MKLKQSCDLAVAFCFLVFRNSSNLLYVAGKSVLRLICHHLGSVSFGSFIISVLKIPRCFLIAVQCWLDTRVFSFFSFRFITLCQQP